MANQSFWEFYNDVAAPNLALREKTFRKVFEYLDQLEGPVNIIETGCARLQGNWKTLYQNVIN